MNAHLNIPERIDNLLRKNSGLHAATIKAVSIIAPWAAENKTTFFPEYTDHSLVHMSEVLASADSLISDEAWAILTSEDAAAIVISVLLHDCALHLTDDGFYSLIEGRYQSKPSKYIAQKSSWKELWQQFFAEAKRFDGRKLEQLFGSPEPITNFPTEKLNLTKRHHLLVGEFLRRHHARLAHEIALSGIPGVGGPLQISDESSAEFFDLAGFIALSHNMALRTATDMLETSRRRVHLGCHVPFVMAVLRIADYIQIQSSRASGQILQLKALHSPVSQLEWGKHASVVGIHQAHDDPECIYVDCEPPTARIFVGMKGLLAGIQNELDQTWAVIGEVYGPVLSLAALSIAIRRIRSNIDDPEEFRRLRRPSYVPREFRFTTASGELMDLLVAPLYGDRPEIGIRELVQNSVDACLERDDLIKRALIPKINHDNDDVTVTVISSKENSRVIVEDYGVGMTADIVEKYFLNIGASFRSSELWRKTHETNGQASLHRTGRFGVGVLAAFLLGARIRVTTKHVSCSDDEEGLSFECIQGAGIIEVQPYKFHHGTRIEIFVSSKVTERLLSEKNQSAANWDWFCLAAPRVIRKVQKEESSTTLKQYYTVPSCAEDISSTPWRRISVDGYDDVLWSYTAYNNNNTHNYRRNQLFVNGILIEREYGRMNQSLQYEPLAALLRAEWPSMIIFDQNGLFPLNLQRDSVAGDAGPLREALSNDVARYHAKHIVGTFGNVAKRLNQQLIELLIDPDIPGFRSDASMRMNIGGLVMTKIGLVPAEGDLLNKAGITEVLIDAIDLSNNRGAFNCQLLQSLPIAYLPAPDVTKGKGSRASFLRNSIAADQYGYRADFFSGLPSVGRRILIRKTDVQELVPKPVPRYVWNQLSVEAEYGTWLLMKIGNVPKTEFDFKLLSEEMTQNGCFAITVVYLAASPESTTQEDSQHSAFFNAWIDENGGPVLGMRGVS